jgi:hypothetical protein
LRLARLASRSTTRWSATSKSKRIQCDEIWSFCYAKERNVRTAKSCPEGAGDVWTWTAIDADTKLILSYFVGDRGRNQRVTFMSDLAHAREGSPADHDRSMAPAISPPLNPSRVRRYVDFAQLVKIFCATPGGPGRYSPGECCGTKTKVVRAIPTRAHFDVLR